MIVALSITFLLLLLVWTLRGMIFPLLIIISLSIVGMFIFNKIKCSDIFDMLFGGIETIYLSKPVEATGNLFYNILFRDEPKRLEEIHKKRKENKEGIKEIVKDYKKIKKTEKYKNAVKGETNKSVGELTGASKYFESDASKFEKEED